MVPRDACYLSFPSSSRTEWKLGASACSYNHFSPSFLKWVLFCFLISSPHALFSPYFLVLLLPSDYLPLSGTWITSLAKTPFPVSL